MMQNFLLQVLRLRLMVCGIYIIIMEDYILREIDKIGKLIEALLQKAGILRRSGAGEAVCETAWTELAEALDLDIDTLLAREDFIGVLIREYGFSDENLEKFAELLFDFAAASPDRDATVRLACGITAIYRYLDEKKAPVSLNRYYILKEFAGYPVASIFDTHDLPDYETYDSHSCPWCRQGKKIDALVNSFGYSSL